MSRPAKEPPGGASARFPGRFTTTVSLGDPLGTTDPMPPTNGSMTLLQLPHRRVGVTCHHVIDAYRTQRRQSPDRVFRAGDLALAALDRLIAEDPRLDLAVLDLDDVDPQQLAVGPREPEFFEPSVWPLGTAEPGEVIALGGYPSFYRTSRSDREQASEFHSPYSITLGTTHVIDVGLENIVCEVGREYWVEGGRTQRIDVVADLGGLSGGPGFVRRGAEFHFVGVIFVVQQFGEYLRLRPARFIGQDGGLRREGSGRRGS